MIERVFANATVTDLDRAQAWYVGLFGREPDANPMAGLVEWHLGDSCGVQVWREPDRAGKSSMTLYETDLDEAAARLTAGGIEHDGPQPVTSGRVLTLADPDGNRIVLTGD